MKKMILVVGIAVMICATSSMAITIHIPDDYATIQAGIDASTGGDTVLVQSGTYFENINFNGHNIVLGSLFLTTGDTSYISSTVIDGDSSGTVVSLGNGEDSTTVVAGFTIQNGSQRGISCTNGSNPKILSNIIKDNYGGGILCYNTNAKISKNIITGNIANQGGGIYCYGVSSTINNNIIWGNTAVVDGGGIFYYYSWCSILNNTIVENTAVGGGGIYYDAYASASILNNIIWDNNGGQLYVNYNSPVVTYCDIQGGWPGLGNINCNPFFCDAENGNYYLTSNSCCVGAGYNNGDIGAYGIGCENDNHIWHVSTTGDDNAGDGSPEYPFATIQHGIDIAVDGDTVMLMPGTYQGEGNNSISIRKNLAVIGESISDSTIIDGESEGIFSLIGDGSGSEKIFVYFNGLTFINTSGCISISYDANSKIEHCNFYSNTNSAISKVTEADTAEISNCYFNSNSCAVSCSYYYPESNLIDSCTFINNDMVIEGAFILTNSIIDGAIDGIYPSWRAGYDYNIVENCILRNITNLVIFGANCFLAVRNSLIESNTGTVVLFGQSELEGQRLTFDNCTIKDNIGGIRGASNGGYLYMNRCLYANNSMPILLSHYEADFSAQNCIFANNDTSCIEIACHLIDLNINNSICAFNDGWGIKYSASGGDINISNSDFFDNTSGNYQGIPDQTGLNGNISEDPLFIGDDPYDYHLQLASPCIDTGDPASPLDPDSSMADMGVYPFLHGIPSMTTIVAPENGDVISPSDYLVWNLVPNPYDLDTVYYGIQIDDDSLFTSIEIDVDSISGYSAALDEEVSAMISSLDADSILQDNARYFWRVNSKNRFGQESGYTDGTNNYYYNIENNPPTAPISGFSPADGEEIPVLTPTILWDAASDPDPDDHSGNLYYYLHLFGDTSTGGYEYYDTTDPGESQLTITEEIPDNSHFFYAVQTVDDEGFTSDWCDLQDYWTNNGDNPPEPFPLYTPTPNLRWVDYYTYFNWGNTVDYDPIASFDFTLEISPDSQFNIFVYTINEITDTAIALVTDTIALAGNDLYWRVLAIDDDSLTTIGGLPEPEVRKLTIFPAGDANTDGLVIGSDVTYLAAYFRSINPAPDPLLAGDTNADCQLIGSDVTYLVQYFRGRTDRPVRGDCEVPLGLTRRGNIEK